MSNPILCCPAMCRWLVALTIVLSGAAVHEAIAAEKGESKATAKETKKPSVRKPPKRSDFNRSYPPKLPGATVMVYKTIGDVKLNAYVYKPKGHKPTDKRPAIVFFFGGGWNSGSPGQFEQQCKYLASRGMVAITADYRVRSRHKTTADKCVQDAKSAVRWVRANAEKLGVDPNRIASGGGSAGGHIAACTGVIDGFDEPGEDTKVSSKPNAMVLFNPALALAPITHDPDFEKRSAAMQKRLGVQPIKLSPAHHVAKGTPPTIIFFGTNDRLLLGAQVFTKKAKAVGNRCELLTWKGMPHGFFNFGRNGNKPFKETVIAMDKFLASLGWIKGAPTLD